MTQMDELCDRAIKTWGEEAQLGMVIEECAELIDALSKWNRHRIMSNQVAEEWADVTIMVRQLEMILLRFGVDTNQALKDKLDRLAGKLAETSKERAS